MKNRLLVAMLVWGSVASTVSAASFTFETTPLGAFSVLTVVDGAQELTLTTEGFPSGFVHVRSALGIPAAMGSRAVIGSQTTGLLVNGFAPLRFSFLLPIDDITFRFGDSGGDDDSPVVIRGFSAADVLLGTLIGAYGEGVGTSLTLSGSFGAAAYFIVDSTPVDNPHSLFWEIEDYTVAAVPEPASLVLFGVSVAGLMHRVRRARRALPEQR